MTFVIVWLALAGMMGGILLWQQIVLLICLHHVEELLIDMDVRVKVIHHTIRVDLLEHKLNSVKLVSRSQTGLDVRVLDFDPTILDCLVEGQYRNIHML